MSKKNIGYNSSGEYRDSDLAYCWQDDECWKNIENTISSVERGRSGIIEAASEYSAQIKTLVKKYNIENPENLQRAVENLMDKYSFCNISTGVRRAFFQDIKDSCHEVKQSCRKYHQSSPSSSFAPRLENENYRNMPSGSLVAQNGSGNSFIKS